MNFVTRRKNCYTTKTIIKITVRIVRTESIQFFAMKNVLRKEKKTYKRGKRKILLFYAFLVKNNTWKREFGVVYH